jgi:hypothetical protein
MTHTKIKAIETRYKGYRFRSRLEARWAVFFDSIDIEWEYEPEGYDLGDNLYYLPDFYFPQIRMYGEVKPDHDIFELYRAMFLCEELTRITGKACLFLFGQPKHAGLWGTDAHTRGESHLSYAWTDDRYWLYESRMYSGTGDEGPLPYQFDHCDCHTDLFIKARDKARSARFEHGERA